MSRVLLFIAIVVGSIHVTNSQEATPILDGHWRPLKTGGGGWMTGLHAHPSGTPVFSRSDVGSAYRWNESTRSWTNVVTSKSMPKSDVHWSKHSGVLSIVSAPSNAKVAYLAYQDCVYRSDDAGNHWARTSMPSIKMSPNDDDSKLAGERLSVDPANADVVYFGSIDDGLWRSNDGGNEWAKVDSVPSGQQGHGVRQILFDRTSMGDKRSQTIHAIVDGEGVFLSNDAGATWRSSKLDVDNPNFYDAEISADGVLYVCGVDGSGRTFHVRRFDGSAWTKVFSTSGHAIGEIALDPFDADRAVLMTHGFSDTYITKNLSSSPPTWKRMAYDRRSTSIPWLAWAEGGWFSLGEAVFDPSVKDRLWIAEGTGVWIVSDFNGDQVVWEEATNGQEHLVSTDIVSLPRGRTITSHWDRPLFLHDNPDTFPKQHQPTQRFNSAWDLDRSPSDPEFVVALVEDHRYCCYDDQHRNAGFSTDGGKTWTKFESQPDVRGKESAHGQIAVSATERDNLVWLPAWNSMPYFTTDRGQTWTKCELPGNSGNCCIAAPWFQREALAADRELPNTFYIYDWAEGHLFQSVNGGKSWGRFESVLPKWSYHPKLRSVFDHAKHLWFAPGPQESTAAIGPLLRSKDGGKTWQPISNTTEVLNVSLGKAAPNTDYPALYIQGRVEGRLGYFRSIDEGASWQMIGEYPFGIYDLAKVMHADAFQYNRLYVGFGGNGFVYFDGCQD